MKLEKTAFPQLYMIDGNWQKDPCEEYAGMTLRDYFAAHSPIGNFLAPEWSVSQDVIEKNAEFAYRWADALIKARNKI